MSAAGGENFKLFITRTRFFAKYQATLQALHASISSLISSSERSFDLRASLTFVCKFNSSRPRKRVNANTKPRLQATLPFPSLQTRLRLPLCTSCAQAIVHLTPCMRPLLTCNPIRAQSPCAPAHPLSTTPPHAQPTEWAVEPLKWALEPLKEASKRAVPAEDLRAQWAHGSSYVARSGKRLGARACNCQLSYGRGTHI